MTSIVLIAPYLAQSQRGVIRIKTVKVKAKLLWKDYYKYQYLSGIGVKLNRIARHTFGSAKSAVEQLERAQRLIAFMDTTGCKPIAAQTCPKSHKDIELLEYPDHLSYWYGPNGEALAFVEPYTTLEELKREIYKGKLTAAVLPHPGIYGGASGKTTSVILANVGDQVLLDRLSQINWSEPLGFVSDINWFEALNLGKGRQP